MSVFSIDVLVQVRNFRLIFSLLLLLPPPLQHDPSNKDIQDRQRQDAGNEPTPQVDEERKRIRCIIHVILHVADDPFDGFSPVCGSVKRDAFASIQDKGRPRHPGPNTERQDAHKMGPEDGYGGAMWVTYPHISVKSYGYENRSRGVVDYVGDKSGQTAKAGIREVVEVSHDVYFRRHCDQAVYEVNHRQPEEKYSVG